MVLVPGVCRKKNVVATVLEHGHADFIVTNGEGYEISSENGYTRVKREKGEVGRGRGRDRLRERRDGG